jgi:hypothetical protein
VIAVASAAGLGLSLVGPAAGSTPQDRAGHQTGAPRIGDAKIGVLDKPGKDFNKSLQLARNTAQVPDFTGGGDEFPSPESVGVSSATLESIAACESGGDATAVSTDGTYRGKYQFDYGSWASVGGSGDPAAAPEAEQDYRAALLYSRSGSTPWPICGS